MLSPPAVIDLCARSTFAHRFTVAHSIGKHQFPINVIQHNPIILVQLDNPLINDDGVVGGCRLAAHVFGFDSVAEHVALVQGQLPLSPPHRVPDFGLLGCSQSPPTIACALSIRPRKYAKRKQMCEHCLNSRHLVDFVTVLKQICLFAAGTSRTYLGVQKVRVLERCILACNFPSSSSLCSPQKAKRTFQKFCGLPPDQLRNPIIKLDGHAL